MWQPIRLSSRTGPEFASSAKELCQQTSGKLIVSVGVVYLLWHFVATLAWPGGIGWSIWVISPIMLATSFFAWWLVSRQFLLAQVVWLAGLFMTITLSIIMFHEPRVAYLYTFLPLAGAIIIGWPAGVAIIAVALGVLWGLSQPGMPVTISAAAFAVVLGGGAFTTLLGWAASDSLLTVVYWSLSSYEQARDMTDEAQRNRGQLARALRDLDQAYYRLQRANAALLVAWRTATEAERFRSEFATTISHELRTPLNLVVGFTEMMMTSPESYGNTVLPGAYRRDLHSVYTSAQHLLALVDDVIDLARIDAGRIALTLDEVNLVALVNEATDMVHDYVSAKGLDLRVHVDDELPPIYLDRLRIRQVLLNLLVNAARFTKQGGITVSGATSSKEVLVRVTDTGQGIPLQEVPRIFDEFRPHEDTSSSPWVWHSGSGLGLPISKRFVELHHGRMGVESVYGQGTTIWFTLPCGDKPEQATPVNEVSHTLVRMPSLEATHIVAQNNNAEPIVIVMNDDPSLLHMIQRQFKGYRIAGAESEVEALGMVEELKPIALLLDNNCNMDLLSSVNVPIIRCPLPSTRRAAAVLGVREMFSKPVARDELLAAVDRLGQPVRRILIADDDPDMVRLFQRMLGADIPTGGCLEAFSGMEALEILSREKPDLVLLDMVMPEVDGFEVLRRMAADKDLSSIPVFVISAQTQDDAASLLAGDIRVTTPGPMPVGEWSQVLGAVLGALSAEWQ